MAAAGVATATALTVGAIVSAPAYAAQSCTPTSVVVGGTTYYRCGSTWYNKVYNGGEVTYIVVNPPPGY